MDGDGNIPTDSSAKNVDDNVAKNSSQIVSPKRRFTKNSTVDSFEMEGSDDTVEMCGWVDVVESPKMVGNQGKKFNVFKFVMNNDTGRRIQVVAWQGQVNRTKQLVEPNRIIHLRGAAAKLPKNPQYNIGNVTMELNIRDHTVIEVKGIYDNSDDAKYSNPIVVTWDNVGDMEGSCIQISGWLKLLFGDTQHKSCGITYFVGSISDGKDLKLAVRVMTHNNLPASLYLGCPITVIGVLEYDGRIPYIKVTKGSDIKILTTEEAMDPDELMDACYMPQKKKPKRD